MALLCSFAKTSIMNEEATYRMGGNRFRHLEAIAHANERT